MKKQKSIKPVKKGAKLNRLWGRLGSIIIAAIFVWCTLCTINMDQTLLPATIQGTRWHKIPIQLMLILLVIIVIFTTDSTSDKKDNPHKYAKLKYVSYIFLSVIALPLSIFKINMIGTPVEQVEIHGRVSHLEEQHHTMIGRNSKTYYYWVAAVDFEKPKRGRLLVELKDPFPYVEGDECKFCLAKGCLGMYYAKGYYEEKSNPTSAVIYHKCNN